MPLVSTTDIIDVHSTSSGDVGNDVPAAIVCGLSKPAHQRTLPTLLLYTETGLRIYDELTTKATEYYLFSAEEEILKKHGDEIIQAMHPRGCFEGESAVELGAGKVISPMITHPQTLPWTPVGDPRLISPGRREEFQPTDHLLRPRSR